MGKFKGDITILMNGPIEVEAKNESEARMQIFREVTDELGSEEDEVNIISLEINSVREIND